MTLRQNSELRAQNNLFASLTNTIQSDNYIYIINDVKGMETCIKISDFDRYHAGHKINKHNMNIPELHGSSAPRRRQTCTE